MSNVFKLHVFSQDKSIDLRQEIAKDEITIGRGHKDEPVDVKVLRRDISRVHLRLFRSVLVVDDLGSTNGTWVDGVRIERAVAVQSGEFQIGDRSQNNMVTVRVEASLDPPSTGSQLTRPDVVQQDRSGTQFLPEAGVDAEQHAALALQAQQLANEVVRHRRDAERLRSELDQALADAGQARAAEELRRENRTLQQRIETLKREHEQSEREAAERPEARLLQAELETLRTRSEEVQAELAAAAGQIERLSDEVAQAEARLKAALARAAEAEADAAAARGELSTARQYEARYRETFEALGKLRTEHQQLQEKQDSPLKPPPLASKLIERLQKENQDLQAQLQRQRSDAPSPNAPQLFVDLRQQIEALTRQLDEARRAPRLAAAELGAGQDLAVLRQEIERLRLENHQLKNRPAPRTGAMPAPAGTQGSLLRKLLASDPKDHGSAPRLAPEEFLVTEQYVSFRRVERVITSTAKDFLQIFDDQTMMPGMDGANFRRLASMVLETPQDESARRDLVRYMELISKWLGASVQAYRRAANRFVDELRGSLSEQGLTRERPLGKLPWGAKAELWERAQAHLRQLSSAYVDDRMGKLAREEANGMINTGTNPPIPDDP
jgi:hypothetical protein